MQHDELGRILCDEQVILPSPEFADSVMAAVRHEASARAPLAFPWKRVLPGLVGSGLALAVLLHQVLVEPGITQARFRPVWLPDLVQVLEIVRHFGVHWIVFALLLAFVSIRFSGRITTRQEMTR